MQFPESWLREFCNPPLDTQALADLLTMAAELPPLSRYVLNRYRKPETCLPQDEERVNAPPYTQKQVEALADRVRTVQPNVVV